MNKSRTQLLLVGIGLVLVGLLSGILIMLFTMDGRVAAPASTPLVERVELGSRTARPLAAGPDSVRPVISVDPMRLNELFKEVARQVTPAVVYIQVVADSGPEEIASWLRDRGRQSVGSGVIISEQGYIITNNHVVENARRIQITLKDKRQYRAEVVGTDPDTDLAVIRIEDGENLPLIRLGDSDGVQVGEWVLAVGNPFRLTSTVTAGIVSALGRQVDIIGGGFRIEDFIQTDAAINPGNSGGALVNLQGELIGISTAIATESGSYEGYGFAVPVNLMARVAEDLIAYGEVQRGYLGISISEVNAFTAEELGMEEIQGVFLSEVFRNGPAHNAGLREGDVVLSVDGQPVGAPNELQSALARYRPGDAVNVEIWREGQQRGFSVVLFGRQDPAYANWSSEVEQDEGPQLVPELPPNHPGFEVTELEGWGLGLRDLNERDRSAFGVEAGAYVAYVQKRSVVEKAGLPNDVVILEVDGVRVETLEDALNGFEDAAARRESVIVRVRRRDGLTAFYEVEVPMATP